jgi:2-isopropylmalate synthase
MSSVNNRKTVQVLDSTLREGEQTPGVCFPTHAKLAIAEALDAVGVSVIEAGHPVVSPNIEAAVRRIAGAGYRAVVAGHARSLHDDVHRALECGIGFLGVFYCVGNHRLTNVFKEDLDTAVKRITRVIEYAREQKPDLVIRYTPEDTVRSDWENVVVAASAAVEAGADVISIADTTGSMIPGQRSLHDFVLRLREALAQRNCEPKIAVHCHNDRGLALANALDAYHAGADIIDTTVLGLGERTGIVDLAQLLVVLTTDYGLNGWNLPALPELYRTVSRYSGIPIPATLPMCGANAFMHCAGVHTHAATKNPVHYQSLDPSVLGREMEVSLDHMSGIASVQFAMDLIEADTSDPDLVRSVLIKVKEVGESGRIVHQSELRDIVEWCQR